MFKKKLFSWVFVLFTIFSLIALKNIFAGEEIKIKIGNKFFSVIEKNDKIFIPTEDLFKELGFAYMEINIDKNATNKDIAHKIFGDDVKHICRIAKSEIEMQIYILENGTRFEVRKGPEQFYKKQTDVDCIFDDKKIFVPLQILQDDQVLSRLDLAFLFENDLLLINEKTPGNFKIDYKSFEDNILTESNRMTRKISCFWPKINFNKGNNEKINKFLDSEVNKFIDEAKEVDKDIVYDTIFPFNFSYSTLTSKLIFNKNNLCCVTFDCVHEVINPNHIPAYANFIKKFYVFDLQKQKQLNLDDILVNDYKNKVADIIIEKWKNCFEWRYRRGEEKLKKYVEDNIDKLKFYLAGDSLFVYIGEKIDYFDYHDEEHALAGAYHLGKDVEIKYDTNRDLFKINL